MTHAQGITTEAKKSLVINSTNAVIMKQVMKTLHICSVKYLVENEIIC